MSDVMDDVSSSSTHVAAVWGRRVFLLVLVLVVGCGAAGLLGVHTSERTADDHGYRLSVRYAGVARAGLDVPLVVTVTHSGGFGQQLQLALTAHYLDMFETQGFTPDPTTATRDADTLYLTFDAPPGDTFTFSYDAYVQPASQRGHSAVLSVLDGGSPVVSTRLSTWLWP